MASLAGPALPARAMSGRPQPNIAGLKIALRPFEPGDAPHLVAAYANPAIQRWHVESLSPEEARNWITSRDENWVAERRADWAIIAGWDLVGRVGLKSIDLHEGVAELTYWILPDHRRRGWATQAGTVLTAWALGVLGMHRLELTHSTQNPSSCDVAQRLGYVLEGTKRDGGLHADGWHDMHLHARLATDPWPDRPNIVSSTVEPA